MPVLAEITRRFRSSAYGNVVAHTSGGHTEIPHLIYDVVLWIVPPSERDCLLYIVRRTFGFQRKARDVISLDQFERGISTNSALRDLGVNRSRNTIKGALKSLVDKGLVDARFECLRCHWEETAEEAGQVEIDERSRAPKCPRCKASLSRSYAIADIHPADLIPMLEANDRQKRKFRWDGEKFLVVGADTEEKDWNVEIDRLRSEIWNVDIIDKAVKVQMSRMKSGDFAASRKVSVFYRPALELQKAYPDRNLLRYAMNTTFRKFVQNNQPLGSWHRYARAVARSHQARFAGMTSDVADYRQAAETTSNERVRDRVRRLLTDATRAHVQGEHEQALRLLDEALKHTGDVAKAHYGGDTGKARDQIKLAFKLGTGNFLSASVEELSDLDPEDDQLPDWQPSA